LVRPWHPLRQNPGLQRTRRARIHALEKELAALSLAGLVETSAGVRSVMIEYDQRALVLPDLLDAIARADGAIGNVAEMVLPSRIVHLPMAFDERWAPVLTSSHRSLQGSSFGSVLKALSRIVRLGLTTLPVSARPASEPPGCMHHPRADSAASPASRWTHEALERYAKSARPEAPYLPSNIQYIANNNGLEGKEDVRAAHRGGG
jgi:allophanate hydrolase subunit 1